MTMDTSVHHVSIRGTVTTTTATRFSQLRLLDEVEELGPRQPWELLRGGVDELVVAWIPWFFTEELAPLKASSMPAMR